MRKNSSFNHFVMLATAAVAMLMASCIKDEVVDVPFIPTESETIGFGINLENLDDTRTSSRNRVGKHDLKSADGEFTLPMGVYVEDGIHSANADKAETRGAKLEAIGNSFTVWASLANGNTSTLFFDAKGVVFENDGTSYKSNPAYFWPGAGTLNFTAVANAPESGFVPNLNTAGTALESFTYTVPADATAQEDIVVATASVGGANNKTVPLNFKHIMSAVNFKVGTIAHGKIKSITLKGVYNTGIYNIDNEQWAIMKKDAANNELRSDYSVPLAGGQFNVDANTASDTFINDQDNGILLMVPQIVGEGATVEIVFAAPNSNDRTLTASIAGDSWGTNKTTNYTISIDEQYNLNITPVGKLLDAHYIIAQVEVTVEGMNDGGNVSNPNQWKLTAVVGGNTNNSKVTMLTANRIAAEESNATKHSNELSMIEAGFWCDEYVTRSEVNGKYVYTPNGKSARGADQITGTGNCSKELIYILIPENNSTVNRTITLTLQKVNDSKVSKAVTLTQRCPGWTDDGKYGWETVDDDEDSQFGFTFTRKIAFEYVYSFGNSKGFWQDWPDPMTGTATVGLMEGVTMQRAQEVFTEDYIVPFAAQKFAYYSYWVHKDYVVLGTGKRDYRFCMVLDYTKLNTITEASSATEGYKNTMALYALGGTATTSALETILLNVKKTETGKENENTFGYHSTNGECGGLDLTEGSKTDLSGILSYILKKNRYYLFTEVDQLGGRLYAPIIKEDDIKWYLPAYEQFESFVPNPNITDKNGGTDSADDYWSSTAADNAANPADAKSYHGGKVAISRATELGVIAVRNKDNDTYEAPATISEIDTEEMRGGENGEAQWVE